MKLPWHLGRRREAGAARQDLNDPLPYESVAVVASKAMPGVTLTVARMSFDRRVALMRRIRELARRAEFLGGGQSTEDKMDSALVQAEIERTYVAWGLKAVSGLVIDGRDANPETLSVDGPEVLFREALAAVRAEIGLSEDQRKNC